jgi:hypothetical protein
MDGAMVACIGSPEPKLLNVVIFTPATVVAARPRAIRHPMRIFSDFERLRVRMSLIGIRDRVRSMAT